MAAPPPQEPPYIRRPGKGSASAQQQGEEPRSCGSTLCSGQHRDGEPGNIQWEKQAAQGRAGIYQPAPPALQQPHGPEQLKAAQKTQQRAEPFQYPGHLPGLKSPQQYQCEQGARADAHRQFRSMCIPPLHTGPPFTDFLPEGKRLRTPLHPKWSPRRSAGEWDDQTPPGYGGP